MRQRIIEMIEQEILNRTSYFTREQDIQLALAHQNKRNTLRLLPE